MSVEVELVRWLLLVAAAVALILAIATALAAVDPTKEPRLLPKVSGSAKLMMPESMRPFFPEDPPGRRLPVAEAAARLWMTLDSHRAGCIAEALAGWDQIQLPAETAHWREIARGTAYLYAGDLECASVHLEAARQMVPDHALVAYFTGVLRLEQAAATARVPKDMHRRNKLLVAYTPQEDKALYEVLAINELRQAIALSGEIRLDQRLLMNDLQDEEILVMPCVGDLLTALGANNYVGKAHHLLFGLYLGRVELVEAEFHLDRAAATGIAVLHGYQDLATSYLDQNRDADAARVIENQANHPWIRPLCQRMTEMTLDAAKGIWVW